MSASYCGGNEYSFRDRSASTPAGRCRNPPLGGGWNQSCPESCRATNQVGSAICFAALRNPRLRDPADDAVPAARRHREIAERDRPPPRPDRLSHRRCDHRSGIAEPGDTTEWFERTTTEIVISAMPARTALAGVHRLSDRGETDRHSVAGDVAVLALRIARFPLHRALAGNRFTRITCLTVGESRRPGWLLAMDESQADRLVPSSCATQATSRSLIHDILWPQARPDERSRMSNAARQYTTQRLARNGCRLLTPKRWKLRYRMMLPRGPHASVYRPGRT